MSDWEAQARKALASGQHRVSRKPGSGFALKAPIYESDKVICIGMNYADHCKEQGTACVGARVRAARTRALDFRCTAGE